MRSELEGVAASTIKNHLQTLHLHHLAEARLLVTAQRAVRALFDHARP
jgi:hypothetical protein